MDVLVVLLDWVIFVCNVLLSCLSLFVKIVLDFDLDVVLDIVVVVLLLGVDGIIVINIMLVCDGIGL